MAKRKNTGRSVEIGLDHEDKRALWRTVLLSSVLLAVALVLVYLLLGKALSGRPAWLNPIRTGVSLLIFWLFTTSAVRTYDRVREGVAALWLVVVGVAVASCGVLLFLLGLRLWNVIGGHGAVLPAYDIIGFYAGGGLVAALISLIHLRVKEERTGNILELVVMALAVVLFFWLAT
jgi:hypothetical protein